MARKKLKTEVQDNTPKRPCDHQGCAETGEYRAPKHRNHLNEYFWFCLDHVRNYNLSWNYFAGLNEDQVEQTRREDIVWERPSWPFGAARNYNKMKRAFDRKWREFLEDSDIEVENIFRKSANPHNPMPQNFDRSYIQATAVLGLEPTFDFEAIKRQYKFLVKKFHPDANGGDKQAEEKFKTINEAFQTLKRALNA